MVWKTTEAGEGIRRALAPSSLDNSVVDDLTLGAVDRIGGDNGARVHNGSAEKRLSLVGVVTFVDDHVVENRDGAGRLTPDGDLLGVAPKGGNVIGNPLQS